MGWPHGPCWLHVAEWCLDANDPGYGGDGVQPVVDREGPLEVGRDQGRSVRGGAARVQALVLRSSARLFAITGIAGDRSLWTGLRVARTLHSGLP